MRLSAAERKELERQRKLFESELARRERAKQRKSDEPDYKKMFREEEKKLNESLMSDDESFVNEADVEFRRRQLMLLKVEKELKPMARGYGGERVGAFVARLDGSAVGDCKFVASRNISRKRRRRDGEVIHEHGKIE